MNRIRQTTTSIYLFIILSACAQQPSIGNTGVDRLSLLKSMMYTNQHLVEIGFGDRHVSEERKQLLLQSYCDLERRDMLDVYGSLKQCQSPVDTKTLACGLTPILRTLS